MQNKNKENTSKYLDLKTRNKSQPSSHLQPMECCLPLQSVFQGTTNHSLPPMNEGRTCSF